MAATSWNPKCPLIRDAAGGIAPVFSFPEGSTQSYKAGALVYLSTALGEIVLAASAQEFFAGIVLEDATGTQATEQLVQIIRAGDLIEFTTFDDSDSAETAADNFKTGFTYDIEVDSGVAYAEVDGASATAQNLHFVRAIYDATGTSTNRGIFTVEGNSLQFGRTA